jgi:translation elongation factor EF-G
MGDVIGDLNARRGRVEGMENIPGGTAMIHAMVPLAEMFGYSTSLRSRTQGRGVYSMQPAHYEPVPKSIQEKVCGTKAAMAKADPVLLEPIMKVDVTVPEDHMGDVIGDLNARRGRVEGMETIPGGTAMIHAMVPLAEMFGYSTALRSRTQGRGVYSMQPAHYEPVPKSIQEKVCGGKK